MSMAKFTLLRLSKVKLAGNFDRSTCPTKNCFLPIFVTQIRQNSECGPQFQLWRQILQSLLVSEQTRQTSRDLQRQSSPRLFF